MTHLVIPGSLDHETILVIDQVVRELADRHRKGLRVHTPNPDMLAAAIADTIGIVTEGRDGAPRFGYWRSRENPTFGHLIVLCASMIEQADAIARAAEATARNGSAAERSAHYGTVPLSPPLPLRERAGVRGSADHAPHDSLPCDCEPVQA